MKKSGVLAKIAEIKVEAEQKEMSDENAKQTLLALLDTLLDYGNDPQIRAAIDEVPF